MRLPLLTFAAVLALLFPPSAGAKTIFVHGNGSGTPLQDAIDGADPGDVLRLDGSFFESIVIDKPLRLRGPVAINSPCGTVDVIEVASDDVEISKLVVYGGSHATIDIQNRDDVKLTKIFVASRPFGGDSCPDAENGISIYNSTDVSLSGCESIRSGPGHVYTDAFIHLDTIPNSANVRVRNSFSNYENTVGILVENSTDTGDYRPGVVLRGNDIVSSVRGILLRNSDGMLVLRNRSDGNDVTGIELDANSNLSRLEGNRAHNNGLDVLDNGSGNCWQSNDFDTGTVSCP